MKDRIDAAKAEQTKLDYLRRGMQLYVSAKAANGNRQMTVACFVDALLLKREKLRPNSWRLVRAAVIYTLEQKALHHRWTAGAIATGIERLRNPPAIVSDVDPEPRTSSTKAKRFPEQDVERVVNLALTRRSPNVEALIDLLHAGLSTGLRPCEWKGAELRNGDDPNARWTLIVANAKNTNGRALGSHRELRWKHLPHHLVQHVAACIELGQDPAYGRLLSTVGDMLRSLTRALWPRRKTYPTLYSVRHEAIARWKSRYLGADQTWEQRLQGLAIIAALCGHASDSTATRHYGRPRPGVDRISKFPVPVPDPARVAQVRQTFERGWIAARRGIEVGSAELS